jgi:hypothetical protein
MKAMRYTVETEKSGTVEVLVAPLGESGFVSVGPVM